MKRLHLLIIHCKYNKFYLLITYAFWYIVAMKFFYVAALIFVFSFTTITAEESKVLPKYITDINLEGGIGFYIGDFGSHLLKDGAYITTPVLDLYISLYIIKYFGMQFLISNGCIIHPHSQPIEGTIIYSGIELFFQYEWNYGYIKLFSGAGYQHTTMLLQWYASGFFEAGLQGGVRITGYMYFISSIKYRMGFLHSIIIMNKYDLKSNDTLASISYSVGFSFRINNFYNKK